MLPPAARVSVYVARWEARRIRGGISGTTMRGVSGVPTGVRNRGMARGGGFPTRPPETENCGVDPMNHTNRDT